MARSTPPVKARRPYDSRSRREQAARNRARILEVAQGLFLRDGYAATTITAIAGAARVSPETIYKTFGGKPGLVRAIQATALAGAGTVPASDRSDEMATRAGDSFAILRGWAILATEVAPRVTPIVLLVRSAAATDPDMALLMQEMDRQRRNRMAHNARQLRKRGQLRPGLSIDKAADVLFAFTAPELFEILVLRQGWTLAEFGDFLYRGMAAELLSTQPE